VSGLRAGNAESQVLLPSLCQPPERPEAKASTNWPLLRVQAPHPSGHEVLHRTPARYAGGSIPPDQSHHQSNRRNGLPGARLRRDARRIYLAARPYRCVRCGYDKHIEVCHKRALTSFPPETPILVVNAPDNLVGLCPNCHWEFDHGLLQL
jgi:hypothetical protein